jgi:CheY-like chemotaxis protein
MPEVNGYEGLRIYRQYLAEKKIPAKILALTAHVAGDDELRLLHEGFDGFIPKPISYEEFSRKLQEALKG